LLCPYSWGGTSGTITLKVQLSKNRLMSSIIPGYIFSDEKKLPNPG
jgi:hypothetical protein